MGAPFVLDMVLVGGEWHAVGVVSAEELEELERMHDAGDLRAEARLELLRHGRAERPRPRMFFDGNPPPAGSWSNVSPPPEVWRALALAHAKR